jgi:hypothetical protein
MPRTAHFRAIWLLLCLGAILSLLLFQLKDADDAIEEETTSTAAASLYVRSTKYSDRKSSSSPADQVPHTVSSRERGAQTESFIKYEALVDSKQRLIKEGAGECEDDEDERPDEDEDEDEEGPVELSSRDAVLHAIKEKFTKTLASTKKKKAKNFDNEDCRKHYTFRAVQAAISIYTKDLVRFGTSDKCKLEVVDAKDSSIDFHNRFLVPRKPVIVTSAVTPHSPADVVRKYGKCLGAIKAGNSEIVHEDFVE